MIKVAPCILSATPFPPESPLSCQGRSEEIYVISVHLRVLRPLRHPPHLSPEVLLAASGEGQRSNSFRAFLNPSSLCLPIRIRTSCWCTTSTCPTPTTTSSSSPAASPSGARRRSGPRRSSSRSSSPCVSSYRRSIWRGGQWEGRGGGVARAPCTLKCKIACYSRGMIHATSNREMSKVEVSPSLLHPFLKHAGEISPGKKD